MIEHSDDYKAGYAAAIEELRACADHWEAYGVKPLVIAGMRQTADAIEVGWYCGESTHTRRRCKARRKDEQPAPDSEAIELADAAMDAGLARITDQIRARAPYLFDESGELRMDEVQRLISKATGGKTTLNRSELDALLGRQQPTPEAAGPGKVDG